MEPPERDPRALVRQYEDSLAPESRRSRGAHFTPEALADRLAGLALDRFESTNGRLPSSLCDPSCGAGSILLSLLDALVARGVDPADALARVSGFELDPTSAAAARESLRQWALAHASAEPSGAIRVADALGDRGGARFEVVVGNPPFGSPLDRDVSERLSSAGPSPYTDLAARHLAAAAAMLVPGGVVAMLQPQSVLAARDARPVRESLLGHWRLCALWATDEELFAEASVRVCALVLQRRSEGSDRAGTGVELHWRDSPVGFAEVPSGSSWGPLLSAAMGTPRAETPGDWTALGDLAHCTAGFRDEFYALAACARDADGDGIGTAAGESNLGETLRLVTSGMIDPGVDRWGERACRIAGSGFTAPVAYAAEVALRSERVARWCRRRAVPKVLVASQTRVLEACVDPLGDAVPLTPVLSVEPHDRLRPEAVAALLSSPTISLQVAGDAAGTGLSSGAVRVSASALRQLRVPTAPEVIERAGDLWGQLTALSSQSAPRTRWIAFGAELDALFDRSSPEAVTWWVDRLPRGLVGERRPAAENGT